MKASSGPWRWGWVDSDGDEGATDSLHDGFSNPMGFYDEGMRSDPEREGNRTLIRLAPDMASLLRELGYVAEEFDKVCRNEGWLEELETLIPLRERLAKLLSELPE